MLIKDNKKPTVKRFGIPDLVVLGLDGVIAAQTFDWWSLVPLFDVCSNFRKLLFEELNLGNFLPCLLQLPSWFWMFEVGG